MSTITTRAGKGSPLTNNEVDANFTNLNTDKAELSGATFTGEIVANAGIALGDNDKAQFGSPSNDLQIYHDGNNSYIKDAGTGALIQLTNNWNLNNAADTQNMITAVEGGATSLFYSGGKKLATTSTGIDVTGSITTDGLTSVGGFISIGANGAGDDFRFYGDTSNRYMEWVSAIDSLLFRDGAKAVFGAGQDLQIYHDGSASYIKDAGVGQLNISGSAAVNLQDSSGNNMLRGVEGAQAALFYNGSEKLATTSTGIDVTGTVTADGVKTDHTDGFYIDNAGTTEASWTHTAATGSSVINVGRSSSWGGDLTIKTDTKSRALFNHNGDISFYEDTGTTPKLFWDASAESLGIGTSSPTSYAPFGYGSSVEVSGGNGGSLIVSDTGQTNKTVLTHYSTTGEGILKTITNKSLHFATNDSGPKMTLTSAGNVGIGTSNPFDALHIVSAVSSDYRGNLFLDDSTTGFAAGVGGQITFGAEYRSNGEHTEWAAIQGAKANSTDANYAGTLEFKTRANGGALQTKMVLDDSGNVGIGVTPSAWRSIDTAVDVGDTISLVYQAGDLGGITNNHYFNSSNQRIYKKNGYANMYLMGDGGAHKWFNAASGTAGNSISFSQAMTLTSGGNLLVGKSSAAFGTAGVELKSSGETYVTRASGTPLHVRRNTDDGGLVGFWKDGATVGSIGNNGSGLYIDSVSTGYLSHNGTRMFNWDGSQFYPQANGAKDLGHSSYRWRDAYLSGGVYLGGTGAANKLDDYEEGSWTPAIIGSNTAGTTSLSVNSATYVKVGGLVTVQCYLTNIDAANSTAVGSVEISGFPFVCEKFTPATATHVTIFNFDEETTSVHAYTQQGSAKALLTKGSSATGVSTSSLAGNSGYVMFQATYKTTA